MSMVARAFNMVDTAPELAPVRTYRVTVFYSVTRADDIDIVDEGVELRKEFDTLGGALDELAFFVRDFDDWGDGDGRISSCWMPYEPGLEVSYMAMLEAVDTEPFWLDRGTAWQHVGQRTTERELNLTVRRVRAAA